MDDGLGLGQVLDDTSEIQAKLVKFTARCFHLCCLQCDIVLVFLDYGSYMLVTKTPLTYNDDLLCY